MTAAARRALHRTRQTLNAQVDHAVDVTSWEVSQGTEWGWVVLQPLRQP